MSVLDLAIVGQHETVADSLAGSVRLAQLAEATGYQRVWYAEHHNMASVASSATAVLIGHIAAHTSSIRLGAGGVMLPNHAPLTIAEQFGTLATLFPDRIDLGLGRAPGTDQVTMRALRKDHTAADTFPDDVLELQGYLNDCTRIAGVNATPGRGTNVPLYILGSSLFGAQLAAAFGLPYGFASHFAPQALEQAVALYREQFRPSAQLAEPYVIAGVNVIVADDEQRAGAELLAVQRHRVRLFFGRDGRDANGDPFTDELADRVLASPQAAHIERMMTYTGVGRPDDVAAYLADFARHADADELMVVHQASGVDSRLRSLELLAEVWSPARVSA